MLRVGVIGLGYWGPKLARNLYSLPGGTLQWMCDLAQPRLDHVSRLYPGVSTTTDYRDVLNSDCDAVCLATPVRTHHHLAMEALRAGKHVLVEKPLAASVAEAQEIVAEARCQKRTLMVGHTFVYNPAVVAMKEIISRGDLGEIYYANGTRVNLGLFQPDINVAWDLAPHDVSILMYVLGLDPESASARGGAYVQREQGIFDVAYVTLYFPGGVLADVRVSWLDPCKIRQYTVVGSRKMLVYDDIAPEDKLVIYDRGVDVPAYSDTEEEFHLTYRWGPGEPYPLTWEEPLMLECQHFLDCINSGTEPRSGGDIGLKVVKVLEAAQRSLSNGGGRETISW